MTVVIMPSFDSASKIALRFSYHSHIKHWKDTMKHSISRRNVVKGAAWATPMVVASASVPAFASSLCTPGITLDVPTNTTTNGDSVTHTFTAGNIEVMTFTLLGGAGGTYQGNARDGHGGSGALVTGTLDLNSPPKR